MNISNPGNRLELLAASYALGTLRGGARRRFEAIAREQATVRAAALVWQGRLASLTELEPGTKPDAAVWSRILNQIEIDKTEQALAQQRRAARPIERAPRRGWLRSLALWRGATAAGALATVVAAVVGLNLYDQLRNAPAVRYVAVLSDEAARASMLVTFDPKRQQLTLQRVGDFREGVDKSLQLWALPPAGGPRSLGVLGQEKLLNLTAGEADVRQVPALAISLEPRGGVPSAGGPTGPVLFKGELIQRML